MKYVKLPMAQDCAVFHAGCGYRLNRRERAMNARAARWAARKGQTFLLTQTAGAPAVVLTPMGGINPSRIRRQYNRGA